MLHAVNRRPRASLVEGQHLVEHGADRHVTLRAGGQRAPGDDAVGPHEDGAQPTELPQTHERQPRVQPVSVEVTDANRLQVDPPGGRSGTGTGAPVLDVLACNQDPVRGRGHLAQRSLYARAVDPGVRQRGAWAGVRLVDPDVVLVEWLG